MSKKNYRIAHSTELPIYDRAIARFPHLAQLGNAKDFCANLCRLAAVSTITPLEYFAASRVANGGQWEEEASSGAMTIKDICSTYGLTQQALSDRFGIPLRSVENWAGGQRQPPEYVINMMVEILEKDRATLESVVARMTGYDD